ncbi:ubiquitin related modifier, putative [Plasmodium gallinaceum]|uniref:Ubiquitin-related modifier 1 homolog n=1 Tax=Plasmodium gallinaceum TaxID=5849 RepID=A0A1J1GV54_PLAGA|nr:ubiquitin related modifier, putative [Plasmodium gallinaceum]CRG96433.1 ubiquitin related modifier, putative [Plasmodium gallinaceum]
MKTKIELKFLGGLESYLENKSKNHVTFEIESEELNFENLIAYVRNYIIVERKDVFSDYVVRSDSSKMCKVLVDDIEYSNYNLNDKAKIKPGIIVLVNEYDWEILDTYSYKIQNNDKICFLSTLHGG